MIRKIIFVNPIFFKLFPIELTVQKQKPDRAIDLVSCGFISVITDKRKGIKNMSVLRVEEKARRGSCFLWVFI